MRVKKIIIMSLVLLLASSSFFLSPYLTTKISSNDFNTQQLEFAIQQENLIALSLALKGSLLHSERWLYLARKLAKSQGKVAFQLAKYNESKNEFKQSVIWYQQAIRLEYLASYISLAQLYVHQNELSKAQNTLDLLFQVRPYNSNELIDLQAMILKIKITIDQGKREELERYVSNAQPLLRKHTQGQLLLDDIKVFEVLGMVNPKESESFSIKNNCSASLQLFATNLHHLKQLQILIENFKKQPLANFVCFSTPKYIPLPALSCSDNKKSAIQCDESQWALLADKIDSRYIGIMLPQGGANVHLGILYFDAKDNVDVFSHEVSHLLGFIDEYPLPENHSKCDDSQSTVFSHNIAVLNKLYKGTRAAIRAKVLAQVSWAKTIKETTPILQKRINKNGDNWLLGTPQKYKNEVGIFPAKTCEKNPELKEIAAMAYQPLSISTQLLHFEEKFPVEYIALLQSNNSQFLMPSFHYNVALAFFKKGDVAKAKYWLKQAAEKEVDLKKKSRILLGDY